MQRPHARAWGAWGSWQRWAPQPPQAQTLSAAPRVHRPRPSPRLRPQTDSAPRRADAPCRCRTCASGARSASSSETSSCLAFGPSWGSKVTTFRGCLYPLARVAPSWLARVCPGSWVSRFGGDPLQPEGGWHGAEGVRGPARRLPHWGRPRGHSLSQAHPHHDERPGGPGPRPFSSTIP